MSQAVQRIKEGNARTRASPSPLRRDVKNRKRALAALLFHPRSPRLPRFLPTGAAERISLAFAFLFLRRTAAGKVRRVEFLLFLSQASDSLEHSDSSRSGIDSPICALIRSLRESDAVWPFVTLVAGNARARATCIRLSPIA